MQERLQFIEHNGCRILLEDFSNVQDEQEFVRLICAAQEVVHQQPPGTALILIDLTDSHFTPAVSHLSKDVFASNTPFVKATALVGVSGFMPVVIRALSTAARREMTIFATHAEALDWLASR